MAKPTAVTRRPSARKRRQALAEIAIPLRDANLHAYRRLAKRAAAVGGPGRDLIRYASWYKPAIEAWVEAASVTGLWQPSKEQPWEGTQHCRAEDPDTVLAHLRDSDGMQVHFRAVNDGIGVALCAEFCRMTLPDSSVERVWTDDQRLTYGDLLAGVPCRGCGRPLQRRPSSGYEMAILDEHAIKSENAEFLARHAGCGAMRWSIADEEIIHCSRCCPPPPLAPSTISKIAKIIGPMFADHELQKEKLSKRWIAAGADQRPDQTGRNRR
jgi:hypothetical protein